LGYEVSGETIPSALIESGLTVMLFSVMRDILEEHQPDVILTTYPMYQAPLTSVFAINNISIPLLAAVTDLATVHRTWFHAQVDLCLVPNEGVFHLGESYGMPADRMRITGIPVSPALAHRPQDLAALRRQLGWEPERTTLLAVGSRRVENLLETLDAINHSGFPLQLVVVAGKDAELFKELQAMKWHLPVHRYEFVETMPDFMHAADLLICKAGGLIVTEALAASLPLIIIDAIPGQETGNAEIVVQGGAGEMAFQPLQVLKVLAHWLENGAVLLQERRANAHRLGTPEAARYVAQRVMELAERGPNPSQANPGQPRLIDLLSRNNVSWQNLLSRARAKREESQKESSAENE
jgi:1,2-diacylglycerol 3-beta-galactosyltransferase